MWFCYLFFAAIVLFMHAATLALAYKCLMFFALVYLSFLAGSYYGKRKACALLFALAMIATGWAGLHQKYHISEAQQLKTKTLLIINHQKTEQTLQLVGETTGFLKQRYQLTFTKQLPSVTLGSYIQVSGKAEPIKSPQNKYLFNYQKYAYSIRMFHQIFNPKIKARDKRNVRELIYHWKNKLYQYIEQTYQVETRPWLQATFLGDNKALKAEYQTFMEIGILQMFTLSARYMKKAGRVLLRVCAYLKIPEWCGSFIMLGFAYASHVFLWKSIAMQQLFISLLLQQTALFASQKKMSAMQQLAGTGLVLVAINPYVIFNLGFIFIFVLRFALLAGLPHLQRLRTMQRRLLFPFFIFWLMLPFTLYQQQSISVAQLFIYLLGAPIGMLFFMLGILLLLWPQWEFLFQYFIELMVWLNKSVLPHLASWQLAVSWLFWFQSCILYVFYFWLLQPGTWKKSVQKVLAIACFMSATHYANAALNSIHFLSLPNGEITIIKEQNVVYLIDVGGSHKEKDNEYQTQMFIIPFLQRLHIERVHHLILTHDDLDHVGDFSIFVESFPIDNVYYHQSSLPFHEFKSMNANIVYHQVASVQKIGCLQIFSIYQAESGVSNNNLSLISYGVFGGKRWLFMGDLEQEGERKLLQLYRDLQIDVLKVGHHGSNTSSTAAFLRKLAPKYAVITVQQRNRHHHPHPAVIKRLKMQEIIYYNTNEVGSIHFFSLNNQGAFVIE